MKIYIIPTERKCNGSCPYCISKARDSISSQYLEPNRLKEGLAGLDEVEAIEITGGGEPSLNKNIDKILAISTSIAPTKLYTNGTIKLDKKYLNSLEELCLSRAHNNSKINRQIMGVEYSLEGLTKELKTKLKLSLVLSKIGIKSAKQLRGYLKWAKSRGASKVVVRELFKPEKSLKSSYREVFKKYYQPMEELINELELKKIKNNLVNTFFDFDGMEVEFDCQECSYNSNYRIIRSDGKIYNDWNSLTPIKQ